MSTTSNNNCKQVYVVVARHGERWDYIQRDAGKGVAWIANADRPWDPPLSPQGLQQATRLGTHLRQKLKEMGLPPIAACYASPFLRCRQTACQAVEALNSTATTNSDKDGSQQQPQTRQSQHKVQIELGLSESLNESWYRSWALPRADGTWGFVPPDEKASGTRRHLHEFQTDELHPSSQVPAQALLKWHHVFANDQQQHPEGSNNDALLKRLQDTTYESSTTISTPFALKPKVLVESKKEQQERMFQVLANKATADDVDVDVNVDGETILLISHGGPVTHLYTKLTGNEWSVHGESKYCCYSIYEGDASASSLSTTKNDAPPKWNPLVVNQSKYLDDLWSDATANI